MSNIYPTVVEYTLLDSRLNFVDMCKISAHIKHNQLRTWGNLTNVLHISGLLYLINHKQQKLLMIRKCGSPYLKVILFSLPCISCTRQHSALSRVAGGGQGADTEAERYWKWDFCLAVHHSLHLSSTVLKPLQLFWGCPCCFVTSLGFCIVFLFLVLCCLL